MLVLADTPRGERLLAGLAAKGMPQSLDDLGFVSVNDIWAPWCIAFYQGEIASIGLTARIGSTGAEVGVTTVPVFRGRGFAAAVVAGWASLPSLRSRALLYSSDRTNISFRRVAERLGLRLIGASFRLT
jgi:RimJ/RimL family protein N-acetyltransferase